MTIWSGPVRRLCVAATLLLQAHPGSAGETAAPPAGAPAEQGGGSFVETFNTLSDRRWYISDGWATATGRAACGRSSASGSPSPAN